MGRATGIAWTRSTRNFWSGCTKVGPGCDGCYAEASSRRMRGLDPDTLEATNWGPGRPRIPHLKGAEEDLRKWNELCKLERGGGKWVRLPREQRATPPPGSKGGKILVRCFDEGWPKPGFWPVFLNSYSDVLDNEIPDLWRYLLTTVTEECTYLNPQLVTKRIGNAMKLFPAHWLREWPAHIWMIVTAVTQAELDRDGPKLLELADMAGIKVIGFSFEPQIEEIDARSFLKLAHEREQTVWGIQGGESPQPAYTADFSGVKIVAPAHPARPFDLKWAKVMKYDFEEYGQPLFFKQTGSNVLDHGQPLAVKGKGDDPEGWPHWLRKQEFPS